MSTHADKMAQHAGTIAFIVDTVSGKHDVTVGAHPSRPDTGVIELGIWELRVGV